MGVTLEALCGHLATFIDFLKKGCGINDVKNLIRGLRESKMIWKRILSSARFGIEG
jgi:hypothetical protein